MSQIQSGVAVTLAFRSALRPAGGRQLDVNSLLKLRSVQGPGGDRDAPELSSLVFFGATRQLSATLGEAHPNLPRGTVHSSTSDGLQSLVRHLSLGEPRAVPKLAAETIDGSAAVFGGPVANLHSRLFMGCGGPSPLFGTILPVTFNCAVPLADYQFEPWQVVVDGRSSSNECLVITSFPMGNGSDRLTIFAGLHGAGTRAIDLVLRDVSLLERLYRETRNFLAWQALIEVHARDFEKPLSIGHFRIFEISNVDFGVMGDLVRASLLFDESRTDELLHMLPTNKNIDRKDPVATGITRLSDYAKTRRRAMLQTSGQKSVPINDLSTAERLNSRSGIGAAIEPLFREEASMQSPAKTDPSSNARRWGRPPKPKSDTSLLRRLTVMVSDQDMAMVEALMKETGVASWGQAVRDSIKRDYERLITKKPISKSK